MEPATNGFEGAGVNFGVPLSLRHLQTHCSTHVERALEYQFLGLLTCELLRRGVIYEVLRSDIDSQGYDLLVDANGVARHIQLKGSAIRGKTSRVPIHTALAAKPSGCVIWARYDPGTFAITGWRWFGGAAGARMPVLGDKTVRHTRSKSVRPLIRQLSIGQFQKVPDIAALADLLFFGHANRQAMRA